MSTWTHVRDLRVLDLDIENRPLSYWFDGESTADITAIAWSWVGQKRVSVALQDSDPSSIGKMLERFCAAYERADVVTAHNIRGHDLPIINGALAEIGMPLLRPKLSSDTLRDIPRWKSLPKSQEYLCEMLHLPAEKVRMSQASWRDANRLTKAGMPKARERVRQDVIQHKALRERLLEIGWLRAPRMWFP